MPSYDFKTLSPIDFEILVRDLLQEELKLKLESFKVGRDNGIDFRCSKNVAENVIVQCKHYAESSFSGLFRQLRDSEVEKAKALRPTRYILAVSIGFTPGQKDDIVTLFQPLIRSPSDVFGKEDLNNLLGRFPEIERRHFKLWFSSTAVFEELLQPRLRNLRRETVERIQRDTKYYVQNPSFTEALDILAKENFCIIAGIPGIGKTTLAEMLLLHHLPLGYDIVKIESDISEAREVDYTNQKRLFYYDDFLGQASSGEKLNKNEDQSLLDFIAAIRDSKASKLILTTREYILNQARLVYEKISRSSFSGQTCIVDLSKYTRLIRAQILFNHVYFSDLPQQYTVAILSDKSYLKIIDHENYNPRIIDLLTDYSRVRDCAPDRYVALFLSHLENPLEIWRHAFDSQLSFSGRNLLLVLATMPGDVFLEDLEDAFGAHHKQFSRNYNQPHSPQDFSRALKELDGNFISSAQSGVRTLIRFHNPSVRDFLQDHLCQKSGGLRSLLATVVFFDQLMWLWNFREGFAGAFKFRPVLRANVTDFVAALERTIGSRNCQLINYQQANGTLEKKAHEISFEQRVAFVVEIAGVVLASELKQLVSELLTRVEDRVCAGIGGAEDVIALLESLNETKPCTPSERPRLYDGAKKLLKTDLWYADLFEPWIRFMEIHPELITKQDDEDVQREFGKYLDSSSYDNDDPNTVREEAEKVTELGKAFGIDASKKIKALEEHADYLEENATPDYDDDERRGWGSSVSDYCSDAEIDSIFRNLS